MALWPLVVPTEVKKLPVQSMYASITFLEKQQQQQHQWLFDLSSYRRRQKKTSTPQLPSGEMNLTMWRIWQFLALLFRPDTAEAADAVAEAEFPVVDAVVVGVAAPLASSTLVAGGVVVSWRALVRLDETGAGPQLDQGAKKSIVLICLK